MYMIAEVSQYVAVASFAEAWIEILNITMEDLPEKVASFAEAWIEIFLRKYWYAGGKSVASFAEAWIEIPSNIAYFRPCLWSPPSRRRGLKFLCIFNRSNIKMSPPSRRRGLKSFVFCLRNHFFQCRLLGNRQGFMF